MLQIAEITPGLVTPTMNQPQAANRLRRLVAEGIIKPIGVSGPDKRAPKLFPRGTASLARILFFLADNFIERKKTLSEIWDHYTSREAGMDQTHIERIESAVRQGLQAWLVLSVFSNADRTSTLHVAYRLEGEDNVFELKDDQEVVCDTVINLHTLLRGDVGVGRPA